MHFTPIALVLLSHLFLVTANSVNAVNVPKHHSAVAANCSQDAAVLAQAASDRLNAFVTSDSLHERGHAASLEQSTQHLYLARIQVAHAVHNTNSAQLSQGGLNHKDSPLRDTTDNYPLDHSETPDIHGTAAAVHAEEAAKLAKKASSHLNTIANSDSLSHKDRATHLERSSTLLNVAGQHLAHAANHADRAHNAQGLLNHAHRIEKNPFYVATGADVPKESRVSKDYHEAWGRRHRKVANQFTFGFKVAEQEMQRGSDPLLGLRFREKCTVAMNRNLALASHHEGRAREAKEYQEKMEKEQAETLKRKRHATEQDSKPKRQKN